MRTRKRGSGLYRYFFGEKQANNSPEKPVQQYTIAQAKDFVQTLIQKILTENNYSHLQKYMDDLMCFSFRKCIHPNEGYTNEDARYVITFDDLKVLQSAKHWPLIREKYIDLVLNLYTDLLNPPIPRIRLNPDRRVYKVILEPPNIKSDSSEPGSESDSSEQGTELDSWITGPQRAGTRRRKKK